MYELMGLIFFWKETNQLSNIAILRINFCTLHKINHLWELLKHLFLQKDKIAQPY